MKIELDLPDSGPIDVDKLPESLAKVFQAEFDRAISKGARKEYERLEAKGALASEQERAELAKLRDDLKKRELDDDERAKKYDDAKAKILNEKEQAIAQKDAEIARRDQRLRRGVQTEIRAAAMQAGARAESLEELEVLLSARLSLDADFNAVVVDAEGKRLEKQGKPVSVSEFVADYLATHPHHRAQPVGRGGSAAGGRTTRGVLTGDTDRDAARQAVTENPSTQNIARLLSQAGKRSA